MFTWVKLSDFLKERLESDACKFFIENFQILTNKFMEKQLNDSSGDSDDSDKPAHAYGKNLINVMDTVKNTLKIEPYSRDCNKIRIFDKYDNDFSPEPAALCCTEEFEQFWNIRNQNYDDFKKFTDLISVPVYFMEYHF